MITAKDLEGYTNPMGGVDVGGKAYSTKYIIDCLTLEIKSLHFEKVNLRAKVIEEASMIILEAAKNAVLDRDTVIHLYKELRIKYEDYRKDYNESIRM